MGIQEDLSGTRWEPGQTAVINNASASEGATQSANRTFLETIQRRTLKHYTRLLLKCQCRLNLLIAMTSYRHISQITWMIHLINFVEVL